MAAINVLRTTGLQTCISLIQGSLHDWFRACISFYFKRFYLFLSITGFTSATTATVTTFAPGQNAHQLYMQQFQMDTQFCTIYLES